MRCPVGMKVQSLLFDRGSWTLAKAKAWARRRGYRTGIVDAKEGTIRLRQGAPSRFRRDTFRTIRFSPTLQAVVACPASARENPTLLVLHNPDTVDVDSRAAAAWQRFHLRHAKHLQAEWTPDIPGLPEAVVALGYFDGIVDENGKAVTIPWQSGTGPWLVTDSPMKRLWIVASHHYELHRLDRHANRRFRAIMYFPPGTSGKHDPKRGFQHYWGDRGDEGRSLNHPRSKWPVLVRISPRCYQIKGGDWTVTSRGIVG